MSMKSYQRRHLRAPFKEAVLFSDGSSVLKASSLNLSEGGMLLDQLPSFPDKELIQLAFPVRELPVFRNFSVLKLKTFSPELFRRHVVRVEARLARRGELAQDVSNVFRSRFGLEFIHVNPEAKKIIEGYVTSFSANLVYLQTLLDSYNTDEETKTKVRVLAGIMGYEKEEKIAQLRALVTQDYRSLQWL
jgi:hypothetical protein